MGIYKEQSENSNEPNVKITYAFWKIGGKNGNNKKVH
jgi:hypothetical protein